MKYTEVRSKNLEVKSKNGGLITSYFLLFTSEGGFSLVEIIVAMAIFIIIATAGVTTVLNGFIVTRLGEEETFANLYAQEGIEAVRSIKNRGWTNLSVGTYGLSKSGNVWNFITPSPSNDSNGKYTRQVTIAQGQRDSNCNIVDSGTFIDLNLFKVTSAVSWDFSAGRRNSVEEVTYLAAWEDSGIPNTINISYYADIPAKDLRYAYSSPGCPNVEWANIAVDSIGDVGKHTSLDINGTTIGISYFDETNTNLKYTECNSNCTNASNWTTVTVDGGTFVGEYTSLVFQNGGPRISYYDRGSLDLKYAECNSNCTNASNWTTVTVDSTDDVGQFTSIKVTGSKVGIAYYNVTNKDLKYAECSTNCVSASNWSTVIVDAQNEPGQYASLKFSSGNPRISYYEAKNKDLKYAECNTNCTTASNWTKLIVDGVGVTGSFTSMAIDPSGNPRISYYKESEKNLKYAECNSNCTSASNWTSIEITITGNAGQYSSLTLENGKPRVGYYNATSKDLEFASCESNCTTASNWTYTTADTLGDTGQFVSIGILTE